MIIDITGIVLTPGNNGIDCLGNGEHLSKSGEIIECCCDECNYMLCCSQGHNMSNCNACKDAFCPHAKG